MRHGYGRRGRSCRSFGNGRRRSLQNGLWWRRFDGFERCWSRSRWWCCCGGRLRSCRLGGRSRRLSRSRLGRNDGYRRLDHNPWRYDRNRWTGTRCCRRLRDNGSRRWLGSDGRSSGRNDRRGRARLRHNLAWLRLDRSGRRCRHCDDRGRGLRGRFWRCHRRSCTGRRVALASFCFLLLFLGQNGLHHVAGLGNVREIDFRCDRLRSARGPSGSV